MISLMLIINSCIKIILEEVGSLRRSNSDELPKSLRLALSKEGI